MKLNKIGIVSSDSVPGPRPYAIFWHVIATLPSTLKRNLLPPVALVGQIPTQHTLLLLQAAWMETFYLQTPPIFLEWCFPAEETFFPGFNGPP